MTTIRLDWSPAGEALAPDGTTYMIQSEHVRGEPRVWWPEVLAAGAQRTDRNWHSASARVYSSMKQAQRAAERHYDPR